MERRHDRDFAIAPVGLDAVLQAGGEAGRLIRSNDWSATPLGPPEGWPPLLSSMVMTCVLSPFPMEVCWGPELTYIYNDAIRSLLGNKHPGALGRAKREVFPEIWDIIGPLHRDVLERAQPTWRDGTGFLLDRKGFLEECYVTFSYSPIMDQSGVRGVFTTLAETTGRVIGERRLRTLSALGAASGVGLSVEDACAVAADTLAANPRDVPFSLIYLVEDGGRAARLLGGTGLSPGSPLRPERLDLEARRLRWPLRRALRESRSFVEPLDVGLVRRAGEWLDDIPPRAAVVVPMRDRSTERATGAIVLGVNPTRELNNAHQGFLDTVGRQISLIVGDARRRQAERARTELLTELNQAKTEFLSNVSHELRTPLTLVLGPLRDFLSRPDPRPQVQRARIELALRSTQRLTRLVDRLLDFSRIEEGRIEAVYEPVDLSQVTADIALAFQPAIDEVGLRLVVECPPVGEPVFVDRELWEKAVVNLVENAFKFTRDGEIRVSCRRRGSVVQVAVSDTGVGIPAGEVAHLFERFHHVRGSWARSREGSGIGLSLVREMVELHGGQVTVQSQEGSGTTVTVTLPLGAGHLPDDDVRRLGAVRAAPAPGARPLEDAERWRAETGAHAPGWAHVVVVEDDPDMRRYIRSLLEPFWRVEAFADGASALAAVSAHPPDLVLADVMLPMMGGVELVRRLRAQPRTARVPVILLSARSGRQAAVEGVEAGADDYVVKPFSGQELVARLRTHVELARARETRARDVERQRVARELHDSVLQTLYGIALASESMKSLAGHDSADAASVAEYVLQLARTALEEMRALIFELRPEVLQEQGLVAAIRRLVAPVTARYGLDVQLDLGAEPEAPIQVKEALFRVAQEALHNVTRHAHARQVRVTLATDGATLRLEVSDDGIGFDPAAVYSGHLGQKTMRERADMVGGTLNVESAPDRGTRVTARVPSDI
jgi:signal transduction histidine kinase/GAF domain-containing protein